MTSDQDRVPVNRPSVFRLFASSARPNRGTMAILLMTLLMAAPSCSSITGPDPDDPGVIDDPIDDTPGDTTGVVSAGFRVVGYHPWWSGAEWRRYDFSVLDAIYFFSLEVDANGAIADPRGWPGDWSELRATAAAAGVPVIPTVSVLDPDTFRAVFGSQVASDHLVSQLVELGLQPGTGGLHLDFEMFDAVTPDIRDRVTDVIRRVREEIRPSKPGFMLSAFALASDPGEAFDESAIIEWVDYLVVQGYDFHWIGGDTTGPVAPLEGWNGLNWHDVTERLVSQGIPRSKILFAVPYYGYEWPSETEAPGSATRGRGIEITYAPVRTDLASARDRALVHGKRRDVVSGSPYYVYSDSTGFRQGWFEDAESLRAKYDFVQRNGLLGVAVFPMAYGDDQLDAQLAFARAASLATK